METVIFLKTLIRGGGSCSETRRRSASAVLWDRPRVRCGEGGDWRLGCAPRWVSLSSARTGTAGDQGAPGATRGVPQNGTSPLGPQEPPSPRPRSCVGCVGPPRSARQGTVTPRGPWDRPPPQTHVLRLARGGRVGSDTARPGRLWLPQAARGPAAAGREPRHENGGFTLAEGKTALRGGLLGGRGHSPLHVICLYLFPLITKSVR